MRMDEAKYVRTAPARSVEELEALGRTVRKVNPVLKMYASWGDDDLLWQAKSKNGWISKEECEAFVEQKRAQTKKAKTSGRA